MKALKPICDVDYDSAYELALLVSQKTLSNVSDGQSRIDGDFEAFAKPFCQKLKVFIAG
jgi:hypothetical protein